MLTSHPVTADEVSALRAQYMQSLAAPIDGMWESFAGGARHTMLRDAGQDIGYFCVNGEGLMLQSHLAPTHDSRGPEAFALAVNQGRSSEGNPENGDTGVEVVRGAMVSSFEPWLTHCLDHQSELRVHSLLYHPCSEGGPTTDTKLDLVDHAERPAVEEMLRPCFEQDPGDWLTGYLHGLVDRAELFVLRQSGEFLGTGELRVSDTQSPYADLGVVVSPAHRSRGIARAVLTHLAHNAVDRGLKPICSTTIENVGAQRAIVKAGFVARHRLLEVRF